MSNKGVILEPRNLWIEEWHVGHQLEWKEKYGLRVRRDALVTKGDI